MELTAKRRMMRSLVAMSPFLLYSTYLVVRRAGVKVLYKPAPLGECQMVPDIRYCEDCDGRKHRLDLYLPPTANWPIFMFVHGGSLISGDKCLRVCGADVYGNIGRFYASRGIGVAVINYRLQPQVTWREQVEDVARATAWLYTHAGNYGGDCSRLFIGGHSAGAQLAARVALDPSILEPHGLSPAIVKGVIAASGAGFDLRDEKTYELGRNLHLYEARFRGDDPGEQWKTDASPIPCITPSAPPFLVMHCEGDPKALQRQSKLLHAALTEKGIESQLVILPGENHCRMVLALSRADKLAGAAIRSFIQRQPSTPFFENSPESFGQTAV